VVMSQPDSILAAELRAARLSASPELRARVLELAARPSEPRGPRLPRLRLRRALLVLAPAAVAVVLVVAVAGGLLDSSSPRGQAQQAQPLRAADAGALHAKAAASVAQGAAGIAPTRSRAQDYEAEMRLRVRDLSATTKRVLALTRSFGGYVRSVDYGSGAQSGAAELVVRIPIGSVQAAILRYSDLGTILDQHVAIRDVQPGIDARFRRLQALRAQIAKLQRRLAAAGLTSDERKALEAALARTRAQLVAVRRAQQQAERRTSFASVSLSLTSRKPVPAVSHPGRVDRALHHARTILVKELIVLLYVAVVGVPILALALLLAGGERFRRRRSTERLLASR
jgi:uncharacterized protein DUF4349